MLPAVLVAVDTVIAFLIITIKLISTAAMLTIATIVITVIEFSVFFGMLTTVRNLARSEAFSGATSSRNQEHLRSQPATSELTSGL